mmetsp:Transcript_52035/g.120943  ORF Transcript_52035/g.120943 Transcript_52035/m.120943 type:complete len:190 (-) Transcript_52035:12-581(-)
MAALVTAASGLTRTSDVQAPDRKAPRTRRMLEQRGLCHDALGGLKLLFHTKFTDGPLTSNHGGPLAATTVAPAATRAQDGKVCLVPVSGIAAAPTRCEPEHSGAQGQLHPPQPQRETRGTLHSLRHGGLTEEAQLTCQPFLLDFVTALWGQPHDALATARTFALGALKGRTFIFLSACPALYTGFALAD